LTLDDWLDRIERLHHRTIDLSLERVRAVAGNLGIGFDCPVFTVGGTNGKGSTCAMLESILRAAGYRVGLYTSPHLLRFNERARIAGAVAEDRALIEQFDAVERARGATSLTYFEFTTLAIMRLFMAERLDAVVLEVGLGGRFDATNIIDADCAIVTSIDLDHMDYLGPTRETIGYEKAHIYRRGRPAICADPQPPQRLTRQRGTTKIHSSLASRASWMPRTQSPCAASNLLSTVVMRITSRLLSVLAPESVASRGAQLDSPAPRSALSPSVPSQAPRERCKAGRSSSSGLRPAKGPLEARHRVGETARARSTSYAQRRRPGAIAARTVRLLCLEPCGD